MDETRFEALIRTFGRSNTRRGVLAALGGLGLYAAPSVIGANGKNRKARGNRAAAASAPDPVNFAFDLPAGDPFYSFPVHLEVVGKAKEIDLPGERKIITAPGQKASLTNLDSGKQIRLNITGTFHQTTLENDDVETVATGRSILVDPVSEPHFALTRGRFTYVVDKDDNLVQPRSGTGNLTDICALLA
jgi:hypothetical protein